MAIPSLLGSYIDETYQRIVQYQGGEFADGTGSAITFGGGTPDGPVNSIQYKKDATNFSGSANLTFIGNDIHLTGSLLVSQSHISTIDWIDFTKIPLGAEPAHNEGRLHWYDDTKTLQIDTDKNGFMIELGHQHVVRVYNNSGADIQSGKVVRINGAQGNQPTIVTASWEDDSSSAATLGLAATLIAGSGGNRHGYVVTRGLLRNVNTQAYTVGTQLYLSSSGDWTSAQAISPLHEVRLGKVVVSNALTGVIYVDIMNGYEIGELHDVSGSIYQTGDLLVYDSGSKVWTNAKTLSGSYAISGSLRVSGSITGSLFGTSSFALTSSFAPNYVLNALTSSFITTGSSSTTQGISGSLALTGSLRITGSAIISGSIVISGSQTSNVANGGTGITIQGSQGSIGLAINTLGGQNGTGARTHILLGQTSLPAGGSSYAIYSSLNMRSYFAGGLETAGILNMTNTSAPIRLGAVSDVTADGTYGQFMMSTGPNSRPQWATVFVPTVPDFATSQEITLGSTSVKTISPTSLEESKYTTHNLYNYQNFS